MYVRSAILQKTKKPVLTMRRESTESGKDKTEDFSSCVLLAVRQQQQREIIVIAAVQKWTEGADVCKT